MYFHILPRGVAEVNVLELDVSFDFVGFVAFFWETVDAGFLWTTYRRCLTSPYENKNKFQNK